MSNVGILFVLGTAFIFLQFLSVQVEAHGRLVEPPSRSSLWRFKNSNSLIRDSPLYGRIEPNYSDNQLFCGGSQTQKTNGGKCGVCGDNYARPHPRDNEAGGKYGLGIISKIYAPGEEILVKVKITAQHRGYFEFRLCVWNNPSTFITQECLDRNLLTTEKGTRFDDITRTGMYDVKVRLPEGVTCTQCVLQWRYHTGNSWGCDGDTCGLGLGHQEEFYGCADIAILDDENTTAQTASSQNVLPTATSRPTVSTSTSKNNLPSTLMTRISSASTNTQWTMPSPATTRTTTTGKTDTGAWNSECKGKILGKHYKWNCRAFYVCLEGYDHPLITWCPTGTVYDGRICNHPYAVPKPCGSASQETEEMSGKKLMGEGTIKLNWFLYVNISQLASDPVSQV